MEIYVEYGFSKETTVNVVKPGKSGAEEIKAMMDNFRANPPKEIGGSAVSLIKDYKTLELTDAQGNVSKLDMPETSNVLQYFTVDGTKISVRPSGTEPKIKFYIEVKGDMGCPKCYASADAEAEEKVVAVRKSLGIWERYTAVRQKERCNPAKGCTFFVFYPLAWTFFPF